MAMHTDGQSVSRSTGAVPCWSPTMSAIGSGVSLRRLEAHARHHHQRPRERSTSSYAAVISRVFCSAISRMLSGSPLAASLSGWFRSEEHTSELQSLMRISYAVFCLKKQKHTVLSTYLTT